MRKSSLGRRSSTQIPVRVSSSGSSSAKRTASGTKQTSSLLKQPGFSQGNRQRRSQSDDRESYGGRSVVSGLQRSSTYGALPGRSMGAMTPITPRESTHSNLTSSSARPPRSQTVSTDSNRRMSSFGGVKNARKDSRPITEKSFQQAAQLKIQKYFDEYGSQVMSPGTSIRPMNTKLFVDMMDHLLKALDPRIVITKSNYLEDLPILLKRFGYRSKMDKSWLLTVNTQHSWPHVVAVLSWLIESIECFQAIDIFNVMYQNNFRSEENEEPEDDSDIMDAEMAHQLLQLHRVEIEPTKTLEEKEALIEDLNDNFIKREIIENKCTDEDIEVIKREIELTNEERLSEVERRDVQLESLESLRMQYNALLSDYQSAEEFIQQSNVFACKTDMTIKTLEEEIEVKKSFLSKKQEDLLKLQAKVSSQKLSLDDKESLSKEKLDLHRMIQYYENTIRGFENTAYSVDIKFAQAQKKLDAVLVEYNKIVAEKVVVEPRLKGVEIKLEVLRSDDSVLNVVDNNFKTLKEEYRNALQALESKLQEAENILWRAKQDEKETEEEIAKESGFLEGVECDLEKQEEMITKENQKLKDELSRYAKTTKEIMEECSRFDSAKLEENKTEVKKLQRDYELLVKNSQILMNDLTEHIKEETMKLKEKITKANQTVEEVCSKHL